MIRLAELPNGFTKVFSFGGFDTFERMKRTVKAVIAASAKLQACAKFACATL
ncbi:hypothetical protein GCM10010912_46030 [Paenibacillus albidus]|uniref:Uncharacterized protein n=1 Tax=Paenibacillus albidus TaxID=2041023 RepID=A0A917FNM1_9BACL|nr:hypothetical protein GCM10010912_46030 [Paenibacillus albidus]